VTKKLKVYEYAKCDTCRRALKFLDGRKIAYEKINITERAPTQAELKAMLTHVGEVRKLFNTSGVAYKEMKLAEKVPGMSEGKALDLLASNGRLVKRPFLLGAGFGFVGFKEEEWKKRL
jgi:Spx/MgsR family transcriptional regulator